MKRQAHTPERYPTKEVTVSDLTHSRALVARKAHRESRSVWSRRVGKHPGPQSTHSVFRSREHLRFVRWTSNDFGTVLSRIDILRAAIPGQRYSTVPWIMPGGESLLRLSGWLKVERVLQLIDTVEALDIDPADAAPDYWHHVHNRLSVNETPRPYTRSRHQAWLHRRRVSS